MLRNCADTPKRHSCVSIGNKFALDYDYINETKSEAKSSDF